ncbi:thiamine diphosphokinase [Natronincola peptidivorans]|uniref:Thiamine diphosphokinase n=1 Tax=Natronincola peptidivorans TaxID=426128 RepID=A0A1H9YBF7_9FIRM|nr:thiamine diphosphokinase [Natronincola peptidivorans]SES66302.1 thiamine diphosphokinase [Natronincola peptidivorans]
MEVVIITNGQIDNLSLYKPLMQNKYIICADGAARYLAALNIKPNLLVGDLDSISKEDLLWMKTQQVACEKFPSRKDETDTELAVEYALKLKAQSITMIGALGSRQDHSLANVMLLYKILKQGANGKIINTNNEITITDNRLDIEGKVGETISLLPLTEKVSGITLTGLEYPLENADITMGSTLGISNVFAKEKATVSLKEGVLLIIKSKD